MFSKSICLRTLTFPLMIYPGALPGFLTPECIHENTSVTVYCSIFLNNNNNNSDRTSHLNKLDPQLPGIKYNHECKWTRPLTGCSSLTWTKVSQLAESRTHTETEHLHSRRVQIQQMLWETRQSLNRTLQSWPSASCCPLTLTVLMMPSMHKHVLWWRPRWESCTEKKKWQEDLHSCLALVGPPPCTCAFSGFTAPLCGRQTCHTDLWWLIFDSGDWFGGFSIMEEMITDFCFCHARLCD